MAWSLRLNHSSNRYMQRAFTLLSTMRAPAEPRALGGGWRGEEGSRVTSYLVGGIDDLADHVAGIDKRDFAPTAGRERGAER